MPDWLMLLLKFATQDLPKVLRRHLSRTIVVVAVGLIALHWIVLGPWGSDRLRNLYLATLLTDEDDMSDLFSATLKRKEARNHFLAAARTSGLYEKTDSRLLDQWRTEISEQGYSDDYGERPSALQLAREKAARAEMPFQPLGMSVTASSPDCDSERPKYNEVYLNDRRDDLRTWQPGRLVRITSQDGRGESVVARVAYSRVPMPRNIQLYLNKEQYAMLRQWEPSVFVLISPTKREANQRSDDTVPTPAGTNCPN